MKTQNIKKTKVDDNELWMHIDFEKGMLNMEHGSKGQKSTGAFQIIMKYVELLEMK